MLKYTENQGILELDLDYKQALTSSVFIYILQCLESVETNGLALPDKKHFICQTAGEFHT